MNFIWFFVFLNVVHAYYLCRALRLFSMPLYKYTQGCRRKPTGAAGCGYIRSSDARICRRDCLYRDLLLYGDRVYVVEGDRL